MLGKFYIFSLTDMRGMRLILGIQTIKTKKLDRIYDSLSKSEVVIFV